MSASTRGEKHFHRKTGRSRQHLPENPDTIPQRSQAPLRLGCRSYRDREAQEAIDAYRTAIRLNPDLFEARVNLGTVLGSVARFDEAIAEFSQAAQLRPDVAEIHVNLSNALRDNWKIDEAIAAAEKALALKPSLAEAHLCLGAALACRGHFDRAIAVYRDAIRIRPDFPAAHLNLALAELVTGNLEQGWPEYEWRQHCNNLLPPRKFSQPAWNGENLGDKTILLYAEQGFGDAIHFIRYVPLVAKMGGKILLECQPALIRLFQDFPGVERIIPAGQALGQFDLHCALPSLPLMFRTTLDSIPAAIPYLAAESEAAESCAHTNRSIRKTSPDRSGLGRKQRKSQRPQPLDSFDEIFPAG